MTRITISRIARRATALAVGLVIAGLAVAPVVQARLDRFGADGAVAPSAPYTATSHSEAVSQRGADRIGHMLAY